jgi:rubrerythrin
MVLPELLLNDEGARDRVMEFKTSEDALFRALRLEKDTLGYYEAMGDLFGEHRALDKIITEEKKHITKLMEYLLTGAKMRGLGDKYAGGYRR